MRSWPQSATRHHRSATLASPVPITTAATPWRRSSREAPECCLTTRSSSSCCRCCPSVYLPAAFAAARSISAALPLSLTVPLLLISVPVAIAPLLDHVRTAAVDSGVRGVLNRPSPRGHQPLGCVLERRGEHRGRLSHPQRDCHARRRAVVGSGAARAS